MILRLANAPVSWGIMEVEGWNPPLPYTVFLDELQKAGYDGTELGPYGYLPTDPEMLAMELDSRSLQLLSAFVPMRLKEAQLQMGEARTVANLISALGARYLVLADALWPEREAVAGRVANSYVRLTDREWDTVAENVSAVCDMVSEFGLHCVFHPHVGSYIETPEEVAWLLKLTGVGLCLDSGHFVYGGGDPVEAVEMYGRRVEYVHFKDVNPARLQAARAAELDFLGAVTSGVFCELGAGYVRFAELLKSLDRVGYDGWAVVEQDVDTRIQGPRSALETATPWWQPAGKTARSVAQKPCRP